jgi:LysM repeat protein
MSQKRIIQVILLVTLVAASLATTGSTYACGGCGNTYYTVQWGDSLGVIAQNYGVSLSALYAANPGLGYWIYPGQVLVIPGGSCTCGYTPSYYAGGNAYTVQRGDTFSRIAQRFGVNYYDLWAANPHIWDPNYIYAGQVLYIPAAPTYYTVQCGDTLRKIAGYYGTTVNNLIALNPQIWDPNRIYVGQVIRIW